MPQAPDAAEPAHANRPLLKALGAYGVASWVAYQVVLALYDGLGLPEWVPKYALLLLIAGLPVVLATAFVQNRTSSPLTWRRTAVGGAIAFAVLGFFTTGFVAVKKRDTLFARGVLKPDAHVLLADFTARDAKDSLNAVAMTESVRSVLSASQAVKLVNAPDVNAGLERMRRSAKDGLPLAVATELARREGYKAIVSGTIVPAGTGYILTIDVVGPDSMSYARMSENVDNASEMIRGFTRISSALLEKIGESVKAVRASVPLAVATTSSLEALLLYTEALRIDARTGGDATQTVPLLERAIALDSTFASAWRKLALIQYYLESPDYRETSRRAYDLSDRLPPKERYLMAGSWFAMGANDHEKAVNAYRKVLELDPDEPTAIVNLGDQLIALHRYAEAETSQKHGTTLGLTIAWYNYVTAIYLQGRNAEALHTLDSAAALFPKSSMLPNLQLRLHAADGAWDRADSVARAIAQRWPDNRATQVYVLEDRARIAFAQGRLAEGQRLAAEQGVATTRADLPTERLWMLLVEARASMALHHDAKRGQRELETALRAFPITSIPVAKRPYGRLAILYATYNQIPRALALIDSAAANGGGVGEIAQARLIIALQRHDGNAALEQLKVLATADDCAACNESLRGEAYIILGRPDSARAAFERYLTTPMLDRLGHDPNHRADALMRAGEMHEVAGDTASAVKRYDELLSLWSKADAALQPRLDSVRRRIRALSRG